MSLYDDLPTPCYVVHTDTLEDNLAILDRVQDRTGCRILLALKGFALFAAFPIIRKVLPGVSASSLNEARLGREEFGGEVHTYAPAYRDVEFDELAGLSDHLIFNSFNQWTRFKSRLPDGCRAGLRINPRYSEVEVDLYNPCRPGSRFGITADQFEGADLDGLSGLHFHTLCEQGAEPLARTMERVDAQFGALLPDMDWLNFGGGHHITMPDYNIDLLCRVIDETRDRYGVQVYLEPGEAIAIDTGVLVASVLDVFHNEMDIAVLDTSATAHMPDVLEMPYRPDILGADEPGKKPHTYRLGGLTCLAGDVIGDYSFDRPLQPGDRLVFEDMAHYTMVKNTTFNGIPLPSIALCDGDGSSRVVRTFGYEDYRNRLS